MAKNHNMKLIDQAFDKDVALTIRSTVELMSKHFKVETTTVRVEIQDFIECIIHQLPIPAVFSWLSSTSALVDLKELPTQLVISVVPSSAKEFFELHFEYGVQTDQIYGYPRSPPNPTMIVLSARDEDLCVRDPDDPRVKAINENIYTRRAFNLQEKLELYKSVVLMSRTACTIAKYIATEFDIKREE